MKFLFIMSLLGLGFQSVSEEKLELDPSVDNILSTYASEVKNCDVDELGVSSFNDVKNICSSLVNSEVCSNIRPEYLLNCNSLVSEGHEIELQKASSDSSLWSECGKGVLGLSGLSPLVLPIAYMFVGEDEEGTRYGPDFAHLLVEHNMSNLNYLKAEEDRLKEKLGVNDLHGHYTFPTDFSCLNKEGRTKVRCDVLVGTGTYLAGFFPTLFNSVITAPVSLIRRDDIEGELSFLRGLELVPQSAMRHVRKKFLSPAGFATSWSDANSSSAGE